MTLIPCIICKRPTGHPDKLCPLCLPLVEHLGRAAVPTEYQETAIGFAIEQAGNHVDCNGVDLSQWNDEQVRAFTWEIIDAYGASLREQIATNEVPF